MWTTHLRSGRHVALAPEQDEATSDVPRDTVRRIDSATPGSRLPSPPPGGSPPELVPPLPLDRATEDRLRRSGLVVRTLREASPEVAPQRALIGRPLGSYVGAASGVALMAASIAGIRWGVRSGEVAAAVIAGGMALLGSAEIVWWALRRRRWAADEAGIRGADGSSALLPWCDLDSIDILQRNGSRGRAHLVFVTRDQQRINAPISGRSVHTLAHAGQALLAMRNRYTTSQTPSASAQSGHGDGHDSRTERYEDPWDDETWEGPVKIACYSVAFVGPWPLAFFVVDRSTTDLAAFAGILVGVVGHIVLLNMVIIVRGTPRALRGRVSRSATGS